MKIFWQVVSQQSGWYNIEYWGHKKSVRGSFKVLTTDKAKLTNKIASLIGTDEFTLQVVRKP
jgi:hypothetical protein